MHERLPIIDMRIRPTFLHKFFGSTPGTPEYSVVQWLNKRVGSKDVNHFERARDLPAFVAEMDDAGLTTGVMVARSTPTVRVGNDELAELAKQSKGRLFAIASVDPVDLGQDAAVKELTRAVEQLGMRGVNIDAAFYAKPLKASDNLLMPLYEKCMDLKVPVFVMSGPTSPNLEFNDPWAVDFVARTFPDLKIVCSHGFYPRIMDIVTVAFRNENVFVSPDMYMFSPGGKQYIDAANGFMQDQYLFGTSYPFRAMKQSVADLYDIGLDPIPLSKVCWKNACRLFGMNPDELQISAS